MAGHQRDDNTWEFQQDVTKSNPVDIPRMLTKFERFLQMVTEGDCISIKCTAANCVSAQHDKKNHIKTKTNATNRKRGRKKKPKKLLILRWLELIIRLNV